MEQDVVGNAPESWAAVHKPSHQESVGKGFFSRSTNQSGRDI